MKIKPLSVVALLSALIPNAYAFDVSPFVVGGTLFKPPPTENWMVSLRDTANNNSHFCGGTIIDKHWVLTAAHCVVRGNGKELSTYRVLEPLNINVMAGVLNNKVTDTRQLYHVTNVVVHSDYSPLAIHKIRVNKDGTITTELESTALDNDIALLRVRTAFNQISPITLATPDNANVIETRLGKEWDEHNRPENTIVTGWGATDSKATNGAEDKDLLEGALSFVPIAECFRRLESYGKPNIVLNTDSYNTKICSLPPKVIQNNDSEDVYGPDSCKGDSGGPLRAMNAEGEWVQIGVVSGGPVVTPTCGSLSRPSFYTRVGNYYSWIQKMMRIDLSQPVIGPDKIVGDKGGKSRKCTPGVDGIAHTNCAMTEGDGGSWSWIGLLFLSLVGFYRRKQLY